MTIIDRKNLKVFGTYAMEGINEIHPRPSESAIRNIIHPTDENSMPIYRLDGQKTDEHHLSSGIYIRKGQKFVVNQALKDSNREAHCFMKQNESGQKP